MTREETLRFLKEDSSARSKLVDSFRKLRERHLSKSKEDASVRAKKIRKEDASS